MTTDHLTMEEAALICKKTPEWLLKQMLKPGVVERFIEPSVYFEKPILLISRDGTEEYLSGWFELDGLYENGAFRDNEMCYPGIKGGKGSRYGSLQRQCGDGCIEYRPVYPLKVHLSDFRIRRDELELFAKLTGRAIGELIIPSEEVKKYEELEVNQSPTQQVLPAHPNTGKPSDDSLLKMVIAMAFDCYGYDPKSKKSTTTADIMAALERCGLSLTENTIRKALKSGADLLPRNGAG